MAQKTKAAKFFCENCGAEVPADAKMCRHCGRFFSSVRCPQCGTTGNPNKFVNGCPTCGYAVGGVHNKTSIPKEKKASRSSRKALRSAISERNSAIYGKQQRGDDSLPWWLYIFVVVLLAGCVALFFRFLR